MSNQFNFQFKERFPLTDRAIETIINSIKEDYGLVVREVKETENGYLFIGRYGFTIGDVTFDESIKKYREFNYHEGVKDRIRDMIPENSLPIFVETVLLPFKNQIIYDSYIQQYAISFGQNMRKEMDKAYKDLLKNKKVKYEL